MMAVAMAREMVVEMDSQLGTRLACKKDWLWDLMSASLLL
jgi:hypothetical protein